jgi:hypothetical protein
LLQRPLLQRDVSGTSPGTFRLGAHHRPVQREFVNRISGS